MNSTWFASPTILEPRGLEIREEIVIDADPDVIDQLHGQAFGARR